MSIESRIRRLVKAFHVGAEHPRDIVVVQQCEDDPDLFEFNGTRMTRAEVREAVGPGADVIFVVRDASKPL